MELAILIIAVIAHLLIGFFTFFHNPKSDTHRFFLLFTIISVAWGIANYFSLRPNTEEGTLNAVRWVMFFAILHAYSLFLLIHTFPSSKINLKAWKLTALTIISLTVLTLTRTSLIFSGILGSGRDASPVPGPAIPLFALSAGFFIVSSIYLLVTRYRKATGTLKSQLQYLIVGVTGSALLIFLTNFVLVVIFKFNSLLTLGSTYTLVFIGATAYAIVAHQLFDIRVIIKRTVVYSGLLGFTLGTYSLIVFGFTALFGSGDAFDTKTFLPNFIAAVFIAIGFEPIRAYLTKVTDKYLFKGSYDPQSVLSELSTQLSDSVDIRQAAQALVTLIKSQLRLSHAAVITFSCEEGRLIVKEVIQDGYNDPAVLHLQDNSFILQQFRHAPQTLITESLRREFQTSQGTHNPTLATYEKLLSELSMLETAITIPISVNKKVIGVFMVGEKRSGDVFMRNEIEFLTIVANQTANAIEKARFWEEDQMKSEFVSIASHELLTPTAAMKGYLSMILDDHMGQVDPTARQFLQKVSDSTNRLAILVEDLLNVSRIESGRLKINKKAFSLVESVKKATDELQIRAKEKSLDLAFIEPTQELPTIYADPDHIYRVIVNLISNAVKYTPKGWVRCFVTPFNQQYLTFIIVDSGLGIPKEQIPHLFEKFNRADRKEIAGIQGTGLGLYISKKIVEMMGGQMWIESEVGKGSTFYFTVPIATESQINESKNPPASTPAQANSTQQTTANPAEQPAVQTNDHPAAHTAPEKSPAPTHQATVDTPHTSQPSPHESAVKTQS